MLFSEIRRVLRWSLLMGVLAALFSLMAGVFIQTAFYEITSNIPSVIRQDSHILLPLCKVFPDIRGCNPWVGMLTSLEILHISMNVGQVAGLSINLILVAALASWVIMRTRSDYYAAGILTGMAGSISTLTMLVTVNIPLNFRSSTGVFTIISLLLLHLSGWVGGQIGRAKLARQDSRRTAFLPGDPTARPAWGGESLSKRELEVLALVASGMKNREIAQQLHISKATVKTHLLHIFAKLGVENRTSAVTQALACGMLHQATNGTDSSYP